MQQDAHSALAGTAFFPAADAVRMLREPALMLGPDWRVDAASEGFCRSFGCSPEEAEGTLLWDLGGGAWDQPAIRQWLGDNLRPAITSPVFHIAPPDGSTSPLRITLRACPMPASAAAPGGIFLTCALEAPPAEAGYFEEIIEAGRDLVSSVNPEGYILYMNRAGRDLLRIPPDEDLSQTRIPAYHPPETARMLVESAIPAAIEAGFWEGESVFLRRDGQEIPVMQSIVVHRSPDGTVSRMSTVVRDLSAWKQTERELTAKEERFRAMVEHSEDLFIITTPERLHYVSANVTRILGYTPEEFAQTPPEALVHPDDQPLRWDSLAVPGAMMMLEYRMRHQNGEWRWIEGFGINLVHHPHVQALVFNLRDITGRKQRDETIRQLNERLEETVELRTRTLRQREAQLREAQQVARLGSWEMDVRSGMVSWSDQLFAIMGYPRSDAAPSFAEQEAIFLPEDWVRLNEKVERAVQFAEPYTLDVRIRRSDGQIRNLLAQGNPTCNAEGEVIRLVGTAQDITERKQAEEALRLLTDRLQLATRAAQVGIWDWDLVRDELMWDDAMYRLYGITPDTFAGCYEAWQHGVHPDDRQRGDEEIRMALNGVREFDTMFRVLWPDGSVRHIKAIGLVQRDSQGHPVRMLGTNWDITQSIELETRLETSRKELEAFSYSVSHDLRAPLRGIDGWSLALLEDFGSELPPKAMEYLGRVRAESQRMGQLIDDLLKLSRISRTPIRWAPVALSDLAAAAAERLQLLHPERQARWQIQPGLSARGDARLLDILLTNLLGNALKFTGKVPDAVIEFGECMTDHGRACFVRDNGAGFNMAYAANLFGAFQRMHKQSEFPGSGIGLATAQRIVHLHNGRIWAESIVNQGATFYFTLNP
ncbi:MAG: PAS domain-containing protein [Bacteroidia bacterium]|nr:PAS domain-containing protein [Bacteroidia bacterium]